MKYFIFSVDDGTIYDEEIVKIFNSFHIKATFNLNSGLSHFVWELNKKPIKRLDLEWRKDVYKGHEIASHTLTHPHLTLCHDDYIEYEVSEDIDNLERIFREEVKTFAFPFEDYDERCIDIIKTVGQLEVIRISKIDESFKFPKDLHHVCITTYDISKAKRKVQKFINDKEAELFVYVFHGYDYGLKKKYQMLIDICELLTKQKDIKIITMSELAKILKNNKKPSKTGIKK